MAIYRLSAKIISRSEGRSIVAAAAYRSGSRLHDERYGEVRDYTDRSGVLHTEIIAPENTPAWMLNREDLWNAIEAVERRKDSQLAREVLLAFPHELSEQDRLELARRFVTEQFVSQGMIADIALHAPDHQGDARNYHCHVLLTMRDLAGDGFGQKNRDWNDKEQLEHWREEWANAANRELERIGSDERIDHRSLEARGIDREPEPKQGPIATEMERNGRESHAGNDRRAAKERNKERSELALENEQIGAEIIDLEAERSARQGDDPLYRMRQQHVRQRAELDEEHKRRREALALEQRQAFDDQLRRLQEDLERRAREEDEARQRRAENARPGPDAGIIDRLSYNFNQTVEKFKDLLDPQRVIERQRREQEEEKRRQDLRAERARREQEALQARQKEQEREMLETARQRENSEKANLLKAQDKQYISERNKIERESQSRDRAQEQNRDNKDRADDRDDRDDDDRR